MFTINYKIKGSKFWGHTKANQHNGYVFFTTLAKARNAVARFKDGSLNLYGQFAFGDDTPLLPKNSTLGIFRSKHTKETLAKENHYGILNP